ncbi:hypothetical protein [Rathayibacter sp. VKM Ac-2630]|uniref:hypothetical protein n=1 Tax=Rathayibacter sp. VKM Ac-2630 TaxID=1938617 RepID=UPI001115AADB|nr:hypothetical protein [Rathayibacter sp. VKM Ac-2630]
MPAAQCRSKKRNGEPCSKKAIKGGVVCRSHGGHLPVVKAKAQQRMQELVLPALAELGVILLDPTTATPDRLRAIALLLDRTGHGPKSEVSIEAKPYERIMSTIYRQVPEGMVVDTYEQGRPVEVEDEDDPDGFTPVASTLPEPGEGEPVQETPVQRGNLTLVVGTAQPPKRYQ